MPKSNFYFEFFKYLDGFKDLAFIIDPDSREILFLNKSACNELHISLDDILDKHILISDVFAKDKHAKVFNKNNLHTHSFYNWVFWDKSSNTTYNVNDILIYIDSKYFILEIASIETKHDTLLEQYGIANDEEEVLNELSKYLIAQQNNFENNITKSLAVIAKAFRATRCVAFINVSLEKNSILKYEWCDENQKPSYLDSFFTDKLIRIYGDFASTKNHNIINVSELEAIFPEIKSRLERIGTRSIITSVLKINNQTVGILNIHNPDVNKVKQFAKLIDFICISVSSVIYNLKHFDFIEKQGIIDPFTQLFNQKAFSRDLKEIDFNTHQSCGIAFVDINDLSGINQEFDHNIGDKAIKTVALLLRNVQEEYKGLINVYCLGNGSFAAIVRNDLKSNFDLLVLKLNSMFKSTLGFSATIGSSYCAQCSSYQDVCDTIKLAQYELNIAKKKYYRENTNIIRYIKEDDAFLNTFCDLKSLQSLVDNNCFYLEIQPIISAKTQEIVYGEALIRFKYEDKVVPPSSFIPLIEDLNLSYVIDYFSFREVCRTIRNWIDSGKKIIPIASNFSRYTMERPDFIKKILDIIDSYQVPRKYLYIEVTESVQAHRYDSLIKTTLQLSKLGFKISLDDFGITNSNIFSLSEFSINTLKLDKRMIDLMIPNSKMKAIIKLFISIARDQNIHTVAEGVETKEQYELLLSLGCDLIQGYYFSKPLPISKLEELINK